jgi:hypothetical protein
MSAKRTARVVEGPYARHSIYKGVGVLRLRDCFALRSSHSAQNDKLLKEDIFKLCKYSKGKFL